MAVIESNSVIDKNKDNYGLIKGLKINSLIILLSGFVILIGSMLVFLLIVKNVYGKFELSEILPTKENILYHPEEEKVAPLAGHGYR